ncbi:uncharacterized protein [Nicotiana sylvestris]|uniref:uncharacterized protein n=1 Tax=Nicotiana sylvestris TaxID=4096 RepID=UPI00388C73F6
MYHDIKEVYWWNNMKKDLVDFVAKCPNCQQVKAEHQRPSGLAQRKEIPMWKWEMINMDCFPNEGYHAIWKEREIKSEVVGDPSIIMPVETIEVNEELSYEEVPISILDRQVRKLKNKEIASVKVLWQNQKVEEATWEAEKEMRKKYSHLFE